MFTAMVLACAIGNVTPETCIEARDTYGPYKTEEECVERVHEMIKSMALTVPMPMQYTYKCENSKGIAL